MSSPGLGASFGSAPGVPGFVDQFSTGLLGGAASQAGESLVNRYNQLGLSGNPQGGTPQSAAAGGTSLQSGGQPSTALGMDLGQIPSLTGGLSGLFEAGLGQMQNASLNQPLNTTGKNTAAGALSGLGSLGGLLGGLGLGGLGGSLGLGIK
jgi:hypothetical protein